MGDRLTPAAKHHGVIVMVVDGNRVLKSVSPPNSVLLSVTWLLP